MCAKPVSNRLRQLRKELGLTQEAMSKMLGIGKSALSMIETGRAELTERNRQALKHTCGVNPDWLETGRGNMLSELWNVNDATAAESQGEATVRLPLYRLAHGENLSSLFADSASFTPEDHICVPGLPACDGAIRVPGDSMYPLLASGDIVFYRQVRDIAGAAFWRDLCLLSIEMEGEEFPTVRYVERAERPDFVRLTSENPRYPAQEIDLNRIRALALVRASLKIHLPK